MIKSFSLQFTIAFLPLKSEFFENTIENIKTHTVYISRVKSIENLKEKIAYLYGKNIRDDIKLKSDNIRVWKLDPNTELEDLKTELKKRVEDINKLKNNEVYDFGDLFEYQECKQSLT